MIITLDWIKDHLKTKANLDSIVQKLTEIGLEVENIKSPDLELDKFLICKILEADKHPNADKLKVCNVKIDLNKIVKVVCAAPNARKGLYSIYAPPGAIIPKNQMKLKIAKIRDVESSGMLCSESELNLSEESNGIVELDKKDKDIGLPFFKKSNEKIIDIAVTPNRSDCLGIRGIARDLASSGIGTLKKIEQKKIKQTFKQPIKVKINKDKDQGCGVFGSCYIRGLQNNESPQWLKNKILALGQKPISAVVDITNYVMFDLNRPLHAYDADKINKEIIVRNSKEGEIFEGLDNKKYILKKNMCVISDHSGPLGLGGIIGGTRSGTEISTKNILLEAAYFYPSSIRNTAKELNIDTDAKFRFERGIDPESIMLGLNRTTQLILSICGGEASRLSIVGSVNKKNSLISLDPLKFQQVIGNSIPITEIKKILLSLGCEVKLSKNNIKVKPPTWRPDLKLDIDLIEELIRIKGYNSIKLIEPEKIRNKETLNFSQKIFHFTQRAVASKGYLETITWSFTDSNIDKYFSEIDKELLITNPISSDLNVLRSSIYSNLIVHIKNNLDRNFEDISLFEIGPVFYGKNPGEQKVIIGGLKTGKVNKKSWMEKERNIDVFDVKNDVVKTLKELGLNEQYLFTSDKTKNCYHPGRSGSIKLKSINGSTLAFFGEIHPSIIKKLDLKCEQVFGFEIFLENITKPNKKIRISKPHYSVSNYQKSERDFAFIIEKKVKSQDLITIIKDINKNIIQDVKVFDIYEGENIPDGKKSIALNVTIQALDKTLTENDLEQLSKKIISTLKEMVGATIRS